MEHPNVQKKSMSARVTSCAAFTKGKQDLCVTDKAETARFYDDVA
jgi:hypothetical protein